MHMTRSASARKHRWKGAALLLPLALTLAGAGPAVAAARQAAPAARRTDLAAVRTAEPGVVPPGRTTATNGNVRRACAAPAELGQMSCLAMLRTGVPGAVRPDMLVPEGYDPADLQSAYKLVSAAAGRGKGETVAVVDAYNDPDAAHDLAVYRAQWGQPACDRATGAGCVTIVNERGTAGPLPTEDPSGSWELEESTDIEMVSAVCPNCHILLVEASSDFITDMGMAEDTAVRLGARFISDSWGGSSTAATNGYFNHPGVAITAAGGDGGLGVSYPASVQYVTSVGGTTLVPDKKVARGWRETAWTGSPGIYYAATGSGCGDDPDADAKPAWQTVDDNAAHGCLNRTDNDVAAVGDPDTPVWFYDTYPFQGLNLDWNLVGGTSVSSPIIASVYALAGAPRPGTYPASYLYQPGHAFRLFPVTSGQDGYCRPEYLCNAADDYPGTHYNGPAGWGTPDGTAAFTDTATGHTITVNNPGTQDYEAGARVLIPVRAVDSAAGLKLAYSATGLPAGLRIDGATGTISGRLPRKSATRLVTVTAADRSGATGSVAFDVVAVRNLRAAYHRVTGPVRLYELSATFCLYDAHNGHANGTRVELWSCDRNAAEQWTYLPDASPDGDGTLVIHGKCATIRNVGPRHSPRLVLADCTGAAGQEWSLQFLQNLYNPGSGECMTGEGGSFKAPSTDGAWVGIDFCVGGFNQVFVVPPGPVLSALHGTCLNDPDNSAKDGVQADATACNGGTAQKWTIFSSDGFTDHNGLCLDATAAGYNEPDSFPGVAVRLQNCEASGVDDYWVPQPDGLVIEDDVLLCLDNLGSTSSRPAKVVVEPCYGNAGEVWAEG
jgi:hypothetical protein